MAISSFLHHVGCRISCPVAGSLALALLAVLQQQQLVTSTRAAYHPRASSCFFSTRVQHFHGSASAYHPRASSCFFSTRVQHFHGSASQLQRRQHTHSDSRAATFRDRKRTDVLTRSLTPHHSTKQCNKRHVAIEVQAKTLLEAQ